MAENMEAKNIQIGISIVAALLILIHLIWPDLAIDSITAALLFIGIIPWLAPLFKSVEVPGVGKIEFRDLEKTEDKAEQAGLLSDEETDTKQYSFQLIASEDPNLAVAGLRIEIEKKLQALAEKNQIKIDRKSVRKLLQELTQHEVLTNEQTSVLKDMIGLMNAAVHGANLNDRSILWVMDIGPRLLASLDSKLK